MSRLQSRLAHLERCRADAIDADMRAELARIGASDADADAICHDFRAIAECDRLPTLRRLLAELDAMSDAELLAIVADAEVSP